MQLVQQLIYLQTYNKNLATLRLSKELIGQLDLRICFIILYCDFISQIVSYNMTFYTYLWSKAIASQIWFIFFASNVFSKASGNHLRRNFLSIDFIKDSEILFESFLGERCDFFHFITKELPSIQVADRIKKL